MAFVDRDGDFNFALLTILPALLAIGLLVDEVQPPRGLHWGRIAPFIVVAVVFILATLMFVAEQRRENEFRRWLLSSTDAIARGELQRDGVWITPETELRLFRVPVALGVLTFSVALCPRIAQAHSLRSITALSTVCGLLTGWWSLYGLFRTPIQSVVNLRGGERIRVADYHAQLVENGDASRFHARQQGQ